MKTLLRQFFFVILILLVAGSIFSSLPGIVKPPSEIPLSEVVAKINAEEVEEITVSGETVTVKLKNGEEMRSHKETGGQLSQTLVNLNADPEKLNRVKIGVKEESGFGFWIRALIPIILPLVIIGFFFWLLLNRAQQGSMQAFSFGKVRARLFQAKTEKERTTFKDVAGVEEAKDELQEVVEFLKHPKKFLDIGARIPRGVLLVGAPGTGKTLLARAAAGEANVPFYHISGSEFVEMFVGVGASRVRDLFETAKQNAPAIVFIDEIDAVGRQRGTGLGGGHDEREQTLNQILVEMDGFDRDTNIIVVAATNRPDILDPALLRPGRFDRRIMLDEPDLKAREAILAIHIRGKKADASVDLRAIAERTPGFSGADLANLLNEAAILAARRNKLRVTQEEIIESIDKVILGPERKSHVFSPKEKEIAAYHEAGHALVAASLPNADPVHKVTIVSRGAAGGYTMQLPIEDRKLHTKTEFLDKLAVMLGGFVSERIVFNELSTGAANDLQKASELARKLVQEYGMSEELGPVSYATDHELVFLGRDMITQRRFSEEIAAKIDREVSRFIHQAQLAAARVIKQKRGKLNEIAKRLVEQETIDRKEFEELMKIPIPKTA